MTIVRAPDCRHLDPLQAAKAWQDMSWQERYEDLRKAHEALQATCFRLASLATSRSQHEGASS